MSVKPSDGPGFFARMGNGITNAGKSIGSKANELKTSITSRFSTRTSGNAEKTTKSGRESLQKLSEGMDRTSKSTTKSQHTIKSENPKYKRLKKNDDIIESWGMGRIATKSNKTHEKHNSTPEKPPFTTNIKSMFDSAKNWISERRERRPDNSQVKDQSSSVQNKEIDKQQLKEIVKDLNLNEALDNPAVRGAFKEYCETKHCPEQLLAYDQLREVKDNLSSNLTPKEKLNRLQAVFTGCIQTNSANEVNIDYSYRNNFEKELSKCQNKVTPELEKSLDNIIVQVNILISLGPFKGFQSSL